LYLSQISFPDRVKFVAGSLPDLALMHKLPNYLRTYRKHAALSQDEVAFLLGLSKGNKISRHEHSARVPSIEALLAYEVIFGVPPRTLFAGTFEKVEHLTKERAEALIAKLAAQKLDPLTARKIQVLRRLVSQDESVAHDLE
jgi:transcriptional regulator with XRE-family HTH domain